MEEATMKWWQFNSLILISMLLLAIKQEGALKLKLMN
jgi:hypothetical protein